MIPATMILRWIVRSATYCCDPGASSHTKPSKTAKVRLETLTFFFGTRGGPENAEAVFLGDVFCRPSFMARRLLIYRSEDLPKVYVTTTENACFSHILEAPDQDESLIQRNSTSLPGIPASHDRVKTTRLWVILTHARWVKMTQFS